MEKLKHVIPTEIHKQQAIDYIKEFYKYNSLINGTGGLDQYVDNYEEWLLKLEKIVIVFLMKKEFPLKHSF